VTYSSGTLSTVQPKRERPARIIRYRYPRPRYVRFSLHSGPTPM